MISVERLDDVAVVRLDHGKVNTLDIELCQAISATFAEIDAKAVVLTGAGRAFSAGVDLWQALDGGDDYVAEFIPALAGSFAAVFGCELPVVAAINGHAIAGGCVFAAACDHRVMADGFRIGVPELLVGVPFPAVALSIVEHAYGAVPARRLIFSGQLLASREALGRGLVDEVHDPDRAVDRAVAHAKHLAEAIPPSTYAATKRHLNRLPAGAAAERYDAEVVLLWQERLADGWIADYMRRTVKRQDS
jgi:enoyl-CoA hydratase/carnithine racemase